MHEGQPVRLSMSHERDCVAHYSRRADQSQRLRKIHLCLGKVRWRQSVQKHIQPPSAVSPISRKRSSSLSQLTVAVTGTNDRPCVSVGLVAALSVASEACCARRACKSQDRCTRALRDCAPKAVQASVWCGAVAAWLTLALLCAHESMPRTLSP
jgi:hypothetical protein